MSFLNQTTSAYPVTNLFPLRTYKDTRSPTSGDFRNFKVGDFWLDTTLDELWVMVDKTATSGTWIRLGSGTTPDISTITPDSGADIFSILGNVVATGFPIGSGNIKGIKTFNGGFPGNILEVQNLRDYTPYVVDLNPNLGQFTSVQSAINQAVADGSSLTTQKTVLIHPGVYNESVTFAEFVNIVGANPDGSTGGVELNGNAVININGSLGISGIRFNSPNATAALTCTGVTTSSCVFDMCTFDSENSTNIVCDNASFSAFLKTSTLQAENGFKNFDVQDGNFVISNCLVQAADTISTVSGAGQLLFVGSLVFDGFTLTDNAFVIGLSCLLQYDTQPVFTIGPTATALACNTIFECGTPSGFFVEGTGVFAYVNISVINSANQVQGTIAQLAFTTYCGNITFDGGVTSVSTKGDLIAGRGGGLVPEIFPVGADGLVLTADSTQSSGLRWGTNTPIKILGWDNLGITYNSGTGTFTVTSADGSALSATNFATVTLADRSTPGLLKTYTVTANQSFFDSNAGANQIGNNLFGFVSGTAWPFDMPFWIYAVGDDTQSSIVFMISRVPHRTTSPVAANIGQQGNTNASTQGSFYGMGTFTAADYDENPCLNLGSFRMQYTGSDWTVQTLINSDYPAPSFSTFEICADGIGQYHDGDKFIYGPSQFGNAAGSLFADNGGTAPIYTFQPGDFSITKDGDVRFTFTGTTNTTAGVGAVNLTMGLPWVQSDAGTLGESLFTLTGLGPAHAINTTISPIDQQIFSGISGGGVFANVTNADMGAGSDFRGISLFRMTVN